MADFGSGTGAFAIQAAHHCLQVHAIDISNAMLDYTEWKAKSQGLTNIVCHHGGFLTYVHNGPPVDAAVSSMALHHLPDFWKQKALARINGMLRQGGKLFLADVTFSGNNCESNIAAWIDKLAAQSGPETGKDIARHVSREYSTFAWIIEEFLMRAGFRIEHNEHVDGVLSKYLCTKISPAA